MDGRYFPGASCLFDGKTTPHYRTAWQYINEKLPNFKPEIGHSDFEDAENKAAEEETGLTVRNCYFHYATCIFRNSQKHGLSHLYFSNEQFKTWLKRVMAIPLLPSETIPEAFKILLRQRIPKLNKIDQANFNKFRRYVQRQWERKIKPKNLSVHGTETTTNNSKHFNIDLSPNLLIFNSQCFY